MSDSILIDYRRHSNVVYGKVFSITHEATSSYKTLATSSRSKFQIIVGPKDQLLYDKLIINPANIDRAFCYSYPNDNVAKRVMEDLEECINRINNPEED